MPFVCVCRGITNACACAFIVCSSSVPSFILLCVHKGHSTRVMDFDRGRMQLFWWWEWRKSFFLSFPLFVVVVV